MGSSYYNSSALAEIDSVPSIPDLLQHHCILVGRAIIQSGATSGYVQSALTQTFTMSSVINHNDTQNIQ
jgi:hypothetical protein